MMLYCRLPEWESMRFVRDTLRPGDVFVDVGANVGTYTLLAAGRPGVRVVAFEPSSATYLRLTENLRLNPWLEVDARRAAVGDTNGMVELTVGLDTVNHVVDGTSTGRPIERVPIVRLDSELSDEPVGIIKIDVEGLEPAVLAGARGLFQRCRPALVVEWNDPVRLGESFAEIGYVAARYLPDESRLVPLTWTGSPPRIQNVIAVPADWLEDGAPGRSSASSPDVATVSPAVVSRTRHGREPDPARVGVGVNEAS
ncbi:FkbM family methyltransferase [Pseudofrankia sp. BMG5.37]|nr:FkbM family methyltransferase [Pseudofrankia sp. BMG5.37]MDT3443989.1 FkbM family methyltransferase [Pseudofrankia sp. BMG5.37]